MKTTIIVGDRFGRWVVTGLPETMNPGKNKHIYYPCRCDCGTNRQIRSSSLRNGKTESCGCYRSEQMTKRKTKHGFFGSRIYHTWNSMKDRCHNEFSAHYHRYGARGIRVCPEWHDFVPFKDWAFANGYSDELTIDRIDNAKGYQPDNCRWATPTQQANNLRRNRYIEAFGERKTLSEWHRDPRCVVCINTLRSRWNKGHRDGSAITSPSLRL